MKALIMLALAVSILLALSCAPLHLHDKIAEWTLPFHRQCLSWAPTSPHRTLYQALICGDLMTHDEFRQALQTTGLLHLMVVSGSHFLFLESLLHRLTFRIKFLSYLVLPTLILYLLMTSAQPPAWRACLSLALGRVNTLLRLQWSHLHLVLISGFLSIGIFPAWLDSISFHLSWTAAAALAIASTQQSLWKQSVIFMLIAPVLLPLGLPHPVSVLCNWLMAPFVGAILFPSSLLAFFVPPVALASDALWAATCFLVKAIGGALISSDPRWRCDFPLWASWLYLGFIQAAHFWRWRRRKRACGP